MTVWNRTREKAAEAVEAGAAWAGSPAEAAAASEVVIAMVTDAAASEAVICGPEGVLEGAGPGLCLIDMSSIPPEKSRAIAASARDKGVAMLDAPVTGNPKVAAQGKLGIMVGGPWKPSTGAVLFSRRWRRRSCMWAKPTASGRRSS